MISGNIYKPKKENEMMSLLESFCILEMA